MDKRESRTIAYNDAICFLTKHSEFIDLDVRDEKDLKEFTNGAEYLTNSFQKILLGTYK